MHENKLIQVAGGQWGGGLGRPGGTRASCRPASAARCGPSTVSRFTNPTRIALYKSYTLRPTPHALHPHSISSVHPTPYTLTLSPMCTLLPTSCTPHPKPYILRPTSYALHPTTSCYLLCTPTPYTLHPTPYTLHPTLYTLTLSPLCTLP